MVWERIREKQEEQAHTARQAALEAEQRSQLAAQQRAQEQQQAQTQALQERITREQQAWSLIYESMLIPQMAALRGGIGGKTDIVVNKGNASVTLVWGKYHATGESLAVDGYGFVEGKVDYSSYTRVKNYSFIEASFNLADGLLKIKSGQFREATFPAATWRTQYNLVVDALADAYLKPGRVVTSEADDNRPSTPSSTPECCCQ